MSSFFPKTVLLSIAITTLLFTGTSIISPVSASLVCAVQKDSLIQKANPVSPDSLNQQPPLLKPDSTFRKPVFQHGSFQRWIATHIVYPQNARMNRIEGKVYVSFVIDTDGSVSEAKILRGICPPLDEEAKRVVLSMPAWKPGYQKGKPVRVSYTLPINFQLAP